MSTATIMFLDIVGFSKNPNRRQRELVDSLTSEVTSSISALINPPSGTPCVIAMPTGDGMALAFLHDQNQPWDVSKIMSLIYRVERWAEGGSVSLRTGVHSGEVEFIKDVNSKTNIVGDTINYAQRVMDAANPKQVLFSDTAFRQYIGSNNPSYFTPPYSSDCKAVFEGPFDVHAKHGMRMLVYKMMLEPSQPWLSNENPISRETLNPPEATLSEKAAPARPSPVPRPRRQIFVGRERELKQLKTIYNKTVSGQGILVTIEGGPGIGKSSICEKLAAYTRLRGGSILRGHCEESSIAYLPFVEAIRSYVLITGVNDLERQPSTTAAYVARIVPELKDKLKITLSLAGDPQEEQYRLIQAVSDFLTNAAIAGPLLVILEDLHDADKGSLQMLTQLARSLANSSILIVGTLRDTEIALNQPLSETLTDIRRLSNCQRIKLGELSIEEVRLMIGGLTRQKVSGDLAAAMHEKTEGNPLFINEVVRYLAKQGLNNGKGNSVTITALMVREAGIPEEVRGVISKRLSKLSPACNRLLALGAVIGREFRIELINRLARISEDELFSALREAKGAMLVEEHVKVGADITYRFSHDFFRETIYKEIIAPERIKIHQQVAQAIEGLYAPRLQEHAVELTEHFSHSSNADDLAKAVLYGEMAAKQAQDVYAHSQAVRLLEHTLKVQEALNASDRAKHCDLLLSLGDALLNEGDPRRILDVEAPQACTLAEDMNDPERSSRVCRLVMLALLYYGTNTAWVTSEAAVWAERLQRNAQSNPVACARADALTGIVKSATWHLEEGIPTLSRAIESARSLGDADTYWWAASNWLLYAQGCIHDEERLNLAEELAKSSRDGISTMVLIWGLVMVANTFLQFALRPRAEDVWHEAQSLIQKNGQPRYQAFSMAGDIFFATLDGYLEKAVAIVDRVREAAEEQGFAELAGTTIATTGCRPLVYLGMMDKLNKVIYNATAPRILYLALHEQITDATDLLEKRIAFLHANQSASTKDESPVHEDTLLLEAAVLLKHREASEFLLRRLSQGTSRTTGIFYATCVDRHLGAASSLLGRYDEAREYYQTAVEISGRMRFRPEMALNRLQIAELILDHYPEEKGQAVELIDFAIGEFRDMKMKPSVERAMEIKHSLGTT